MLSGLCDAPTPCSLQTRMSVLSKSVPAPSGIGLELFDQVGKLHHVPALEKHIDAIRGVHLGVARAEVRDQMLVLAPTGNGIASHDAEVRAATGRAPLKAGDARQIARQRLHQNVHVSFAEIGVIFVELASLGGIVIHAAVAGRHVDAERGLFRRAAAPRWGAGGGGVVGTLKRCFSEATAARWASIFGAVRGPYRLAELVQVAPRNDRAC